MTTTTEAPTSGEVAILPVEAITVEEGFNPRGEFEDREAFADLAEDVKENGVLVPILVEPAGDGEHYLLRAGERRLRAARKARLTHVPALIRDANGKALVWALVENLVRAELTPVEEARAIERLRTEQKLNQKEIAKRIRRSPGHVSERLRLLRLPDAVQRAVDAGSVPVTAAPTFEKLAKVSPAIADACAELIAAGDIDAADFADDPTMALDWLDRSQPSRGTEAPFCVAVGNNGRGFSPLEIPLPEGDRDLAERYEALFPKDARHGYRNGGLRWTDKDTDAARAFGCLIELTEGHWTNRYICDEGFYLDRMREAIECAEQAARDRAATAAKAATKAGAEAVAPSGDPIADREAAEKARRAAERKAEREHAIAARGTNLDLGAKLAEKLHEPKLTKDAARLLTRLVLRGNEAEYVMRGLRYTDPKLQKVEVTTVKSSGEQREKVTYADRAECATYVEERLKRAKTPEQIIGVVLQVLAAARFADQGVVARSKRAYTEVPGYTEWGQRDEPCALIEKLAKPTLPPAIRDQLAELDQKVTRWQQEDDDVADDEGDQS